MNNSNVGNVFSNWFENSLLNLLEKYFDKFTELTEARMNKPRFIKQKNALNYYDGIDAAMLKKYESLGLKRCESIESGVVYYQTSELDRFMLSNQN
ncbi:hypothetical protein BCR22_14035 [Enterococcus plantarum]|uniref:hypothetical protein n=1 Tax=Enterococcus plantarum TaxID=1077675 RepID=UPI00084D5B50|nr:hypothetical protein [Enterococcus plantarum]OEG14721.1 hypothetical protein BCR22_14035 [Enterococcus plantarum]